MIDDILIIPCPDFKTYQDQPTDQSKCKSIPCPKCNELMWFSEKKKKIVKKAKYLNKEIILACYPCILNEVEKMKDRGDIYGKTLFKQVKI